MTASSRPERPAGAPLTVVRVIARLNVGGPARHVVLLNRGLRDRGYDALLVHGDVGPGEASMADLAATHGLRVTRVAALGPRISALSDLRALFDLVRIVFRESPDVVHTHTAKAGTLGRLAAAVYNLTRPRSRRALVVHTFHGHVFTGYFSAVGSALVRATERLLARVTDCIVTISPAQRHDIVSRFAIARDAQVVTIPLGLDLDPLLGLDRSASGMRTTIGLRTDDVVFGYVGRFVPVKDIGTLMRAFVEVHRSIPRASLMLVGDGPCRPEMEQMAADASIADSVRFVGWTGDLREIYAAMDVCLLSSVNEGTPVAVIEAMAAGRPVIATAVGGVPDVVADGETGLLVPPRDPATLARAMLRLAGDPDMRRRMGDAGRRAASSRFTWARLVDDIDQLYIARLSLKRGTIARISCR